MRYQICDNRKSFYRYLTNIDTNKINIKTTYGDTLLTGPKLYSKKGKFAKIKVFQYLILVKFYRDDQTANNCPNSVTEKYVFLNNGIYYSKNDDNRNLIFKTFESLIYINLEKGYFERLNLIFKNFQEFPESKIIQDNNGKIWKSVKGNKFTIS